MVSPFQHVFFQIRNYSDLLNSQSLSGRVYVYVFTGGQSIESSMVFPWKKHRMAISGDGEAPGWACVRAVPDAWMENPNVQLGAMSLNSFEQLMDSKLEHGTLW